MGEQGLELRLRARRGGVAQGLPQGHHHRGLQRGGPARARVQGLPLLGLRVPGAARPRRERERRRDPARSSSRTRASSATTRSPSRRSRASSSRRPTSSATCAATLPHGLRHGDVRRTEARAAAPTGADERSSSRRAAGRAPSASTGCWPLPRRGRRVEGDATLARALTVGDREALLFQLRAPPSARLACTSTAPLAASGWSCRRRVADLLVDPYDGSPAPARSRSARTAQRSLPRLPTGADLEAAARQRRLDAGVAALLERCVLDARRPRPRLGPRSSRRPVGPLAGSTRRRRCAAHHLPGLRRAVSALLDAARRPRRARAGRGRLSARCTRSRRVYHWSESRDPRPSTLRRRRRYLELVRAPMTDYLTRLASGPRPAGDLGRAAAAPRRSRRLPAIGRPSVRSWTTWRTRRRTAARRVGTCGAGRAAAGALGRGLARRQRRVSRPRREPGAPVLGDRPAGGDARPPARSRRTAGPRPRPPGRRGRRPRAVPERATAPAPPARARSSRRGTPTPKQPEAPVGVAPGPPDARPERVSPLGTEPRATPRAGRDARAGAPGRGAGAGRRRPARLDRPAPDVPTPAPRRVQAPRIEVRIGRVEVVAARPVEPSLFRCRPRGA